MLSRMLRAATVQALHRTIWHTVSQSTVAIRTVCNARFSVPSASFVVRILSRMVQDHL